METTALTPLDPAKQQLLQQYQSEIQPQRLPPYPQLKMVNTGSSIAGMKKGEYYAVTLVKEDDSSEAVKKETSVGLSPEVVVLRRRYTYSFFDEKANDGKGKLVAWTNEIDGFGSDFGPVHLKINAAEPTQLSFPTYQDFKKWKQSDEKLGQQLDFKNVLYVLFQGAVYRMFVSNASVTGVKDGEKTGDYQDPQPGSFALFENTLRASEPQAYFQRKVKLGSRLKQGGMEFYLMTFEDVGRVEDLDAVLSHRLRLDKDLQLRFEMEFRPGVTVAPRNVIDVDAEAMDVSAGYGSEISADQLPF